MLLPIVLTLAQSPAADTHPVYAALGERLTYADLAVEVEGLERGARPAYVEARLRDFASTRQANLRAVLDELEGTGEVQRVRELWIANAVRFEGTPAAIERVAALPEVAYVGWDPQLDESDLADVSCAPRPPFVPFLGGGPAPEPNLVKLQAPDLWALGFDGAGVLVLNVDLGVYLLHSDLVGGVWINPLDPVDGIDNDGNGYVDDVNGWDFQFDDADVSTTGGHGTKTSGLLIGNGTGGTLTGMAPGAKMAVGKVASQGDHWEAMQYGIGVGVDCVSSSVSFKFGAFPPDYHMHRSVSEMLLAAGIPHANSIGNQAGDPTVPIPFNIAAPGNCPSAWRHFEQTQIDGGVAAVLGCGAIDIASDSWQSGSGLGPAAWEDVKPHLPLYPYPQNPEWWDYPSGAFQQGLLKPDVVAYTNVLTTKIHGGYTLVTGTTAAAAHVGGALCLLTQVQPKALPRHVSQALQRGAQEKGAPGKDPKVGAGKVQVLDAAKRLLHLVTATPLEPSIGSSVNLSIDGAAGDLYVTVWGLTLGSTPTPFGTLDLAPPFFLLGVGALDASGHDAFTIGVPNEATIVGIDVRVQSLEDNQAGIFGEFLVSVVETLRIAP